MALSISCLTEMLDCLPNNLFVITVALSEIISTEVRPLGESVLIQTLFSAVYTKLIETAEQDAANKNTESTALSKSSICMILAEAICSVDEDNKHTEGIRNLILKSQNFTSIDNAMENNNFDEMDEPMTSSQCENTQSNSSEATLSRNTKYEIDSNEYIPELICCDLLATSIGKQSVKVIKIYS